MLFRSRNYPTATETVKQMQEKAKMSPIVKPLTKAVVIKMGSTSSPPQKIVASKEIQKVT